LFFREIERETRRGNLNWSPTFTLGSGRGERRMRERERERERERAGRRERRRQWERGMAGRRKWPAFSRKWEISEEEIFSFQRKK
jgi:hypothetical protein